MICRWEKLRVKEEGRSDRLWMRFSSSSVMQQSRSRPTTQMRTLLLLQRSRRV